MSAGSWAPVLETVRDAARGGYARAILVGDGNDIDRIAGRIGLKVDGKWLQVVHQPDVKEAALTAARLVHGGKADILMKGLIASADFLRAVLHREHGLRTDRALTALGIAEMPSLERLLVIDVNNCLDGDGPMSANRAGAVPNIDILEMAFDQHLSKKDIWGRLVGNGGLVSHLGTENLIEIEGRIENGDGYAKLVLDSMIYQISKEIGGLCTALKGQVDAIALTGGMAHSDYMVGGIRERVGFLAPVLVYPGECEMEALYEGALRVMEGREQPVHFKKSGKKYRLID